MPKHDIGLVGLAVMGQNLVLNMANNGFSVGVFNRTTSVTEEFVGGLPGEPPGKVAEGTPQRITGYHALDELVRNLKSPRKIMLMVKAGPAVDAIIGQLTPLLSPGDILIDGGNTHFADTNRRTKEAEAAGLLYIGAGVSGGEEGALKGPSIMPGGTPAGWPHVKEIFQTISAKVGPNNDIPCCEWVGEAGAGHYVKMVHNGIEYGDMQLICEAYFLLKHALGLSNDELHRVFADWNRSELESYLIEITRDIFTVKDSDSGEYLVDRILDTAQQKGTGKWMSQHALDLGVPTTLITEAVYARCLSAQKDARVRASKILSGPERKRGGRRDLVEGRIFTIKKFTKDGLILTGEVTSVIHNDDHSVVTMKKLDGTTETVKLFNRARVVEGQFIEDVRQALYASKICSYAQGFVQLDAAAQEFGWKLNNGNIALLWRGGCIIRAAFLQDIKRAFDKNPNLENLLLDDFFRAAIDKAQPSWRRVVATAVQLGLPVPGFAAALCYYDGYRRDRLPANLLQAQRDYFGAHTYQRVDREGTFHTDWIHERKL